MDVRLVAFESMGVRSMCTFVRTPELAVLIDPSAACHGRSGLKPHPTEYEALIRKRSEMLALCEQADVVVTSHYHLDHLSPLGTDLVTTFSTRAFADRAYAGKILLCKDPNRNVTDQQGERGRDFHRAYLGKAAAFETADGRDFAFGRTRISFSPALWHGKEGTVQGYVVGTCVDDGGERVVHASDVQLLNGGCVDWMLEQRPELAIVAGPPIFDRERVQDQEMDLSLRLLQRLAKRVPSVIVDHHLLRSADWRSFLQAAGDLGNGVHCAADGRGVSVLEYEARRPELYEREKVDVEFHQDLERGRMPNRLRPVVEEVGMTDVYKATLGW